MTYTYATSGTCSRQIDFELDGNIIKSVVFTGGCHGNLQGIARLSEGRSAEEIIDILEGVHCGFKPTSCPDQFANALRITLEENGF